MLIISPMGLQRPGHSTSHRPKNRARRLEAWAYTLEWPCNSTSWTRSLESTETQRRCLRIAFEDVKSGGTFCAFLSASLDCLQPAHTWHMQALWAPGSMTPWRHSQRWVFTVDVSGQHSRSWPLFFCGRSHKSTVLQDRLCSLLTALFYVQCHERKKSSPTDFFLFSFFFTIKHRSLL